MSVFTLEALFARKGDALILHYGPWESPSRMLIDGGPRGVYKASLRPRLSQLREEFQLRDDEALDFELAMVSHIDDDHIAGIIDFFEEIEDARDRRRPRPWDVKTLWHNSFDDILSNRNEEIFSRMVATAVSARDPQGLRLPTMTRESRAVVATTRQGRTLRDLARKLRVRVNAPFKGLIMAPAETLDHFDHGLRLTIIGPSRERVVEYRKKWDKDLKKILKKKSSSAQALAFADASPFNLASICVLAEMQNRRMLLTGDARGDFLIEDMEEQGLLKKNRSMHVDVFKVPHHGSDRNVTTGFFRRITADHYVISGDGEHDNPDRNTLEMIEEARGRDEYTIHFTFTRDLHKTERNTRRRKALKAVQAWVAQKPDNCAVRFRDEDDEIHSVYVDLLEPLYED